MCLAIPGIITSIDPADDELFRTGKVSFDGIVREVNLSMVPEAGIGDYVLVHVGVALQVVDEEEAKQTLATFRELDEFNEAIGDYPDGNKEE